MSGSVGRSARGRNSDSRTMTKTRGEWLCLLTFAVCFSCNGKSTTNAPAEVSDTGFGGTPAVDGTGNVIVATGSEGSDGTTAAGAVSGTGGNAPANATVTLIVPGSTGSEAGSGGESGDDACDVAALWTAINTQAGVTACWEASAMLDPDEEPGPLRGSVVIDDEGHVVDNTGLRVPENKQRWLEQWGDHRWPCLAGQTIGYECAIPN